MRNGLTVFSCEKYKKGLLGRRGRWVSSFQIAFKTCPSAQELLAEARQHAVIRTAAD